jgi:cell fate (sporulation/competence/biofilm development) regulator YlbF (YheA/YmcA/DUF963 family)
MSKTDEMAKDLGQALGRTDEYQALRRAAEAIEGDRELVEMRGELEKLESELVTVLRSGNEPDEESRSRYESLAQDLQARPEYQKLVSAQANFDKILQRVNETISEGIREGAEGRIILP